jgi:anaerobic selenocysteine-containing dehydrogenase
MFGPCAVKSGDICSGAGDAAQLTDFGEEDSNDLFDLLNAKTIVLWGKNPHVSNVHIVPVLKEAREKGARIVMIDPVRHRGADLAQMFVQPRPGGDIALALGIARYLFEAGRADPAAGSYCDHLESFRSLAFSRSAEAWAELADVRSEELVNIADLYADGPSAILVGWGLQRKANGSATVRLIDALGAISGNLGISGGGVSFYYKRRGAFDTSFEGKLAEPPRRLAESLLGREILEAKEPAIRMVWVTAGNPVAMLPDSLTVKQALETRELTVVVDAFLTDTARAAHLVLPTTTMLEDDDLVGAYGHHWLGEVRPVVPAPEGVKTDYAIAHALAERLGLAEHFSADVDAWKRRFLSMVSDKGASLEAIRDGYVRNPLAPKVLFADRKFPTASGRVNLIQDADPTPARPTAERPLLLMAFSTEKAQSSQWAHPHGIDGPAVATVHPDSAAGFSDGAIARIESEVGSMDAKLKFDARQRRDVLIMAKGGWLRDGRCANALIPARATDAGGGAVYYDTPVRLTARS